MTTNVVPGMWMRSVLMVRTAWLGWLQYTPSWSTSPPLIVRD